MPLGKSWPNKIEIEALLSTLNWGCHSDCMLAIGKKISFADLLFSYLINLWQHDTEKHLRLPHQFIEDSTKEPIRLWLTDSQE